jgi:hypothetical protein
VCTSDEKNGGEKSHATVPLNMRNGSETNPVSLQFALKRKKFEAKPTHPTYTSLFFEDFLGRTVDYSTPGDHSNAGVEIWLST